MHFFVNTYILYIETPRPNTNRHVHADKCLHCAGIEHATSYVARSKLNNQPNGKSLIQTLNFFYL
jgi:hypothetical protein